MTQIPQQPPPARSVAIRRLWRDRRGVAVIEMALALPLLVTFLFGIVTYGSWIALAHAVQQSANEGARASLSGLTQAERATLAQDTAYKMLKRSYGVEQQNVAVTVQDDGDTLILDIAYDASRNPLLSLPMIPLPSTTITRRTAVKLAGL
jgi:Flp pilus assembly protein TadG